MENILVVEDEPNILKLVSVNLASRGYEVSEAKNGTEALARLRLNPPSLMVLDIKLPDITGWEVLQQIKSDPNTAPPFPVLIMTASIRDAYVDASSYPSVRKVLIKPFSSRQLLTAVEGALGHSEQKLPQSD